MAPAPATPSIRGALWASESSRPFNLLTVGEAIGELSVVALDASENRRPLEAADRRSLASDVGQAISAVGRALGNQVGATLTELKLAAASANTVLSDVRASRQVYERSAAVLRGLAEPDAARAAFDDLLRVVDDGASNSSLCVHRARQFQEICERQGRDWSQYRTEVEGLLRKGQQVLPANFFDSPVDDIAVVWLAFGNAQLDESLRVGPIQLFGSQTPETDLMHGSSQFNHPHFEAAWELTGETLQCLKPVRVDDYVLARIEITGPQAVTPGLDDRRGTTVDWARRLVLDLIAASTFRLGGSRWHILDGALAFTGPGTWYGSMFHNPRERIAIDEWARRRSDPTAEGLREVDPTLLDDLASRRPPAYYAVEEARWHQQANASPDPAQRAALRIREFERLPPATPRQPWHDTVYTYLSGEWAMDRMSDHLFGAGVALRNATEFLLVAQPNPVLTQAASAICSATDGNVEVNLQAVIEKAGAVAAEFAPRSWERRLFLEIVRRSKSGDRLRRWLLEYQAICKTLIRRSARQRNSIVHGRLVCPEVIRTIDGFLGRLSGILVATAVDVAMGSVEERLEQARTRYEARLSRLEGAATATVYFEPIN